ncbi:MAG: hypothetical protein HQM13_11145 [SAR324 cluster bacterium]|nr:hypothetical protein [SAR324 cluster bacterium]
MRSLFKKIFILSLATCFFSYSLLFAQQAPAPDTAPVAVTAARPPVMKSIFWNTAFGSAWGAIMGAVAALSSPAAPFRDSLILGTTFGGMIGYGFGVYLVVRGISFDPNTLPTPPTTPLGFVPISPINSVVQDNRMPFSAEMRLAEKTPAQGWQTTIFQTTF